MKILMTCPAPPGSRKGNRVTAVRWVRQLRQLGHHVRIAADYGGQRVDQLIALHARKSWTAIATWRRQRPDAPLIVVLTGTDLYHDIRTSKRAQQSLELADQLVLLQPKGADELTASQRRKARVVIQSAEVRCRGGGDPRFFEVCVLGHLRREKDPLRAGLALRHLPATSRIRVTQCGAALSPDWERRAKALVEREPRYRWLGEVAQGVAHRVLCRSQLLVLSSRLEGGANVISEALAAGVPVLASRIPGSVGLLGGRYPGYYPVGDSAALAALLHRAETEPGYLARLRQWCAELAPMVRPEQERASWQAILAEFAE